MKNRQNPYGGADGAAPAAGVAFTSSNNTHNLYTTFSATLVLVYQTKLLNDTTFQNFGSTCQAPIYNKPDSEGRQHGGPVAAQNNKVQMKLKD